MNSVENIFVDFSLDRSLSLSSNCLRMKKQCTSARHLWNALSIHLNDKSAPIEQKIRNRLERREKEPGISNKIPHCMNVIKWLMWMRDKINWHKYRQSKTHLCYSEQKKWDKMWCIARIKMRNTSPKENVQECTIWWQRQRRRLHEEKKNRFDTSNEWLKCIKYVEKGVSTWSNAFPTAKWHTTSVFRI